MNVSITSGPVSIPDEAITALLSYLGFSDESAESTAVLHLEKGGNSYVKVSVDAPEDAN